jgi:hypothetical protein
LWRSTLGVTPEIKGSRVPGTGLVEKPFCSLWIHIAFGHLSVMGTLWNKNETE